MNKFLKSLPYLFFIALFGLTLFSFTTKDATNFTVVIDAGHGGKDPGCSGSKTKEKDVALAVALKVGNYIKENMKDVKVVYTRDSDVFVELDERTAIANRNKADLFISVHCNAAKNKAVLGAETYTIGMHKTDGNLDVAMRENAVILKEENHKEKYQFDPYSIISYIKMSNFQSANQTKSIDFATKVQKQFEERVNRENRGVKQSGFLVLWKTAMPAALIEIGFLTNTKEEGYLKTDNGQTYIASGIYRAFKEYKNEVSAK
ncbi:N-acetylmuramoyl-L-alanine amidase [Bernardetia sp. OM2101]|uniref:N-acetylmuramoyl-L-alanine amidase family protein n=1 Tax=Bernardetia sp. OM2101 TaxID=3344876 RepID=UPI0035CEE17B